MEIPIIKIGNSKGFRLSKALLEKYRFKEKAEMILGNGHIIIKPIPESRKGWEKAFREMHENGDDQLLIEDIFEDEDLKEWK
jgi:antitoxin MazE